MSFKLHYDRERNDELCDPEKYYSKFEGVNYHDTIMVTRKEVYFNPHKQPRTENQNIGNVEKLSTSIITKNYDHKYRPQSADIEKENGVFDGTAGWNRDAVYDSLSVDVFPLDLLSFDSEYDKHKYRGISNNEEEHHTAAASMSQIAIKEEIKVSLRKGWLPKNKEGFVTDSTIKAEIVDYTTVVLQDGTECQTISDEDRKKMLKDIRSSFPKNDKLQTYNKEVSEIAAESLDIPYGGYNETSGKIGYILTHTVGKDGIWFIFHANPKCSHLPVEITFAIEKPNDKKDKTIEKRKALKKSLYDAIDQKAVEDAKLYDLDVSYTREKIKKKKIICNGFLNSYVDETEGTNKSYVLVDENGKLIRPKHD
tara:strand:- start:2813 stop:3913 length:1101 start_codon:yes stop_codon:yes gene_type:complete